VFKEKIETKLKELLTAVIAEVGTQWNGRLAAWAVHSGPPSRGLSRYISEKEPAYM